MAPPEDVIYCVDRETFGSWSFPEDRWMASLPNAAVDLSFENIGVGLSFFTPLFLG